MTYFQITSGTDGLHTSRYLRHEREQAAAPCCALAAACCTWPPFKCNTHIRFILDNVCQGLSTWQPMATDTEPSKLPRKRARRERERERERREREERESSKRERREREPSNLPQHYKSYCVTAALSPRLLHSRASSLAARAPESCRPNAECTFAEYSRAASFTWTSKNIK